MTIVYPTTKANSPSLSSSATALAANTARIGWAIQNQATGALFVLCGSGATTGKYHFTIKGGTATEDGNGGTFVQSSGVVYTGIITVAAVGTPSYTAFEMAP